MISTPPILLMLPSSGLYLYEAPLTLNTQNFLATRQPRSWELGILYTLLGSRQHQPESLNTVLNSMTVA